MTKREYHLHHVQRFSWSVIVLVFDSTIKSQHSICTQDIIFPPLDIFHTHFFLETFILNHIKMYSDRKASPILYVSPFPNLVFWGGDILITPVWGFVNQTSFFYTFKSSIIAVMRKMYQYTQCRRAKEAKLPKPCYFLDRKSWFIFPLLSGSFFLKRKEKSYAHKKSYLNGKISCGKQKSV